MKRDAGTASNPAIEKRLDQITEQLLQLNDGDLAYFIGYWDAFSKASKLDADEEASMRAGGFFEMWELGYADGLGDRKEYDERH
jgi:hypothetical protein